MSASLKAGADGFHDMDKGLDESTEVVKLPQIFSVKWLGKREARGLWGIKHTRKPVDDMVSWAKDMPNGVTLPLMQLIVDIDGVQMTPLTPPSDSIAPCPETAQFAIDAISYGVQDLVYTRVFAMIIVKENDGGLNFKEEHPFQCYGFVCDSRGSARKLTFALASAFQEFSKTVQNSKMKPRKFAIDLRTPDEISADLKESETEA